jgi:hypothetical protein
VPDKVSVLLIRWIQETEVRLNTLEHVVQDRLHLSDEELEDFVEKERAKLPLPELLDNGSILNGLLRRALERP